MLGIYFRKIVDESKDSTWDITPVDVVLYVLTIYFPVLSLS